MLRLNLTGTRSNKVGEKFKMEYRIVRRDDSLQHHGIKGMKWGERRWQYKDGSLTPEGYIHYGYGKNTIVKHGERARGEISVLWAAGGGHSMAWEVIDGKPVIFDCQTGDVYKTESDFERLAKVVNTAVTTRLDNVEELNEDFLLRWVEDAA